MASKRAVNRIIVNVLLDGALAAVAAPVARYLAQPSSGLLHPIWFVAGGAITLVVGGLPFGLQLQYWRFSSLADMIGVACGSALSAALFTLGLWATGFPLPTVTFPAIYALTLLVLLAVPRITYRLAQARRAAARAGHAERVLLVGADQPAELFLRAVARDGGPGIRVDGLLAFGGHQPGRRIHGRPILGRVDEAGVMLERLRAAGRLPDALVVTDPEFRGPALARLIEQANRAGVAVRRAPRPTALSDASEIELRPVSLEDLLNRQQVPLDRDGMRRLVAGRRVLVTGAGGSIGSELCRQVASLGPGAMVLLDSSEYALWQIGLELAEGLAVGLSSVIADVRDRGRLREVFETHRPELVFHAAALKHVPMVEANPLEGLLTNAVGTRNLADAARAAGADAMVVISTDKAVNPSSLMGASKRLAEIYCQGLHMRRADAPGATRFVTVRFGNVLGSTGSVVPVFRRQLERGGPLTVTHPDMQRYFMTVTEAVGLVLQASVAGGERGTAEARALAAGGIFVLDMGAPLRIDDLARQMIRLAGLRPDVDVAITYTGLRPGEKLFEELFHGQEPPVPTGYPGLLMATPRTNDPAIVGRALDELEVACRRGDERGARAVVMRLVPEYAGGDVLPEAMREAAPP
jgi:O-antigen biosynthesis protein WbqV